MEDIKITLGMSSMQKSINLLLDYQKETAKLNKENIKLDVKPFVREILLLVSSWEEKMIDNSILDGLSYYVHIKKDGKIFKFEGQNKFPKNFNRFLHLLMEANLWQ